MQFSDSEPYSNSTKLHRAELTMVSGILSVKWSVRAPYALTSFADAEQETSKFLNCKKVCSRAPAASH
jgi:hypothetical protein